MTQLLLALDFGGTKHTAALAVPGEHEWRATDVSSRPPAPTPGTTFGRCAP